MKYALSPFLTTALLFSTSCYAQDTHLLSQERIEAKTKIIEKRIMYDRCMKHSFTALAVANELYKWVPVIKDLFSVYTKPQGDAPEMVGVLASIKASFEHLFYTKEGWTYLVGSAVGVGSSIVISKVSSQFIHPDTFRWYIQSHAPYYITIKLMNEQLELLQKEDALDQHDRAVAQELVCTLFKRLVIQAELMCTYLVYKTEQLPTEEKLVAQRAKGLMFDTHNKRLTIIADMLKSDNPDYYAIRSQIDSYALLVKSQVNHFSIIEGEEWSERSAVKKSIKRQLKAE